MKPKLSPDEFRKSMGFDIKNKPARLGPIADAIREAEKKRTS